MLLDYLLDFFPHQQHQFFSGTGAKLFRSSRNFFTTAQI
jgi:hypothetical protein